MSDASKTGQNQHPVVIEELHGGFARYCGSVPFDELPIPPCPNEEDYHWAMTSRELHRQYQRMVVAVRHRTVWGAGKDYKAAWEDARKKPGCPEERDLAFVDIWGMPGNPEDTDKGAQGA